MLIIGRLSPSAYTEILSQQTNSVQSRQPLLPQGTSQDPEVQVQLRLRAARFLASALRFASFVKKGDLADTAAGLLWNAALAFTKTTATRVSAGTCLVLTPDCICVQTHILFHAVECSIAVHQERCRHCCCHAAHGSQSCTTGDACRLCFTTVCHAVCPTVSRLMKSYCPPQVHCTSKQAGNSV